MDTQTNQKHTQGSTDTWQTRHSGGNKLLESAQHHKSADANQSHSEILQDRPTQRPALRPPQQAHFQRHLRHKDACSGRSDKSPQMETAQVAGQTSLVIPTEGAPQEEDT